MSPPEVMTDSDCDSLTYLKETTSLLLDEKSPTLFVDIENIASGGEGSCTSEKLFYGYLGHRRWVNADPCQTIHLEYLNLNFRGYTRPLRKQICTIVFGIESSLSYV